MNKWDGIHMLLAPRFTQREELEQMKREADRFCQNQDTDGGT